MPGKQETGAGTEWLYGHEAERKDVPESPPSVKEVKEMSSEQKEAKEKTTEQKMRSEHGKYHKEPEAVIRTLREGETALLKDFLYEAIFIPEGVKPPERDIVEKPELRVYTDDFGSREGDCCLVADLDGRVVGAVWTRIMNDYGHVDDETPSFAISLYKEYRGRGIGTELMKEMLDLLRKKGYKRASLAVQKDNYAVRMYEKTGFRTVDENDEEYIMVCVL